MGKKQMGGIIFPSLIARCVKHTKKRQSRFLKVRKFLLLFILNIRKTTKKFKKNDVFGEAKNVKKTARRASLPLLDTNRRNSRVFSRELF
ncbi:hypothetical protein Barb4_05465 [Bacteroidales bacterium Barb4]|nr:hypothetical protein Barb4_05465 [Bacteroidales bacterium Barb4]